jgi:hypothetical protein
VTPATSRRRARRRRLVAVSAVVALGGIGLAACGVPVSGTPAAIARHDVPFGLLAKSPPTSTTTTSPSDTGLTTVQIYLVGPSGRLVAEARDVPSPVGGLATDQGLVTVLQALIDGPTAAETTNGLQGEIPTQTKVLSGTGLDGPLATVDLSTTFGQLAGQSQIEAIAQVVYTVTGNIPGVSEVTFEIAGQPASVPLPDGALVTTATQASYASLGPG